MRTFLRASDVVRSVSRVLEVNIAWFAMKFRPSCLGIRYQVQNPKTAQSALIRAERAKSCVVASRAFTIEEDSIRPRFVPASQASMNP